MIQLDSSAGRVDCYVARPPRGAGGATTSRGTSGAGGAATATAANASGVLLLHAWWGLTDHFKRVCARLAAEGFVALAPDLHRGQTAETPERAKELVGSVPDDERMAIVGAAVNHLKTVTGGKVGLLAFSMGAAYGTWLSAERPDAVQALVLFYGGEDWMVDKLRAPVQWHFAETDEFVSTENVRALERQAHERGWEVYVYPGTEHAFFNTSRPEAYKPEAAALAWERLLGFYRRYLA